MRAVVVSRAGWTRGPDLAGGAGPRPRTGRGAGRGRRQRGQPGRPAAARRATTTRRPAPRRTRVWSAPAGSTALGEGVDGLVGGRRGLRPALRRRVRRAGGGARPGSCCRCRRASTWSTRPRCPRSPAPCGRTSSCWPGCGRARPCWCTAARSGIGTMAIQLRPRDGRPGRGDRRVGREAGALPRARRRDPGELPGRRTSSRRSGRRPTAAGPTWCSTTWARSTWPATSTCSRPTAGSSVIGMQGGTRAELDLGLLMRKRGAVLSTRLRARPADEKAAIVASTREHVWPLIEAGDVRPVVDRVLPMAGRRRGAPGRRGRAATSARSCSPPPDRPPPPAGRRPRMAGVADLPEACARAREVPTRLPYVVDF